MKAIGSGGEWWWNLPSLRRKPDRRRRGRRNTDPRGRRRGPPPEPLSSSSSESIGQSRGWPIDFPFTQAVTAASLTLTGDTIAQVRQRIVDRRLRGPEPDSKGLVPDLLMSHDWLRALRMASYGFLLYGPGSHAWYQFLDQCMPKPTFANLSTKVILNQIALGPCVIGVIFAWNNLWTGKLSELPSKYRNDALPTLLFGFRFWIPVSIINFWMVPLSARVAFMSSCAIFWNFYLSTTMSK
ncbi:hypothetical protein OsI_03624 [Oryza sativa Indica Group]|uniref:Uncharacterized protein n=2 Tax=Oryza TaxID=4527 RepID=B8A912_ORYSI|nr:uncharacterized protein LOC127774926 [Oryza glaberrima]EEC71429.1 hypothetical protein OsI_03624 [Oryza sativa Indica Group]